MNDEEFLAKLRLEMWRDRLFVAAAAMLFTAAVTALPLIELESKGLLVVALIVSGMICSAVAVFLQSRNSRPYEFTILAEPGDQGSTEDDDATAEGWRKFHQWERDR